MQRVSTWGKRFGFAVALSGGLLVPPLPVQASSGDAWEEFAKDVEETCLSAALGKLLVGHVQVDPYGSESFGFALLTGIEPGTNVERVVVCVYNKGTQTVELSGYLEK